MNLFDNIQQEQNSPVIRRTQNKPVGEQKRIFAIQKGITNKNTEFDRLRRLAIQEIINGKA